MRRLLNKVSQWKSFAKEAVFQSLPGIKCLCLLHVTGTYVCSPVIVSGVSMLPTLNFAGDVLLTEHLSSVRRGDVVIVRSPEDPMKKIAKRVVAVAGDEIVYHPKPNDYMKTYTVKIPDGCVWLQGDNYYASRDSRQLGPIPYGLIVGKVFCRVWPPRDFGFLAELEPAQ